MSFSINHYPIECKFSDLSRTCSFFDNDINQKEVMIPGVSDKFDYFILYKIFNNYNFEITPKNIKDLALIGSYMHIYVLEDLEGYSKVQQRTNSSINAQFKVLYNDETTMSFMKCQELILDCNSDNLEEISYYLESYVLDISCREMVKMIYNGIFTKKCSNILAMIELIFTLEEMTNLKFMKEFCEYSLNEVNAQIAKGKYDKKIQEGFFIIRFLYNEGFISLNEIESKFLYSIHPLLADLITESYAMYRIGIYKDFEENYYTTKANNWEVHKLLIKDIANPFPLCINIKHDKVNEIVNDPYFDTKKLIRSAYECCSIVNNECTVIEYAAFYGAYNCFKCLLNTQNKLPSTLIYYACAGGNQQIFTLCLKLQLPMKGSLEGAIKYHNHEIMEYLIENYQFENISFKPKEKIVGLCLRYQNYSALFYICNLYPSLLSNILIESTRINNTTLTLWALKLYYSSRRTEIINKQIGGFCPLVYAAKYLNHRIVKTLLEEKEILSNQLCGQNDVLLHFFILKHLSYYVAKILLMMIVGIFTVSKHFYFQQM
ncbi:hypothetical protein TRFO_32791 [Tritrichomonas foetus]|uniref:DUF3447 domain-containing protein n=1 Tax=Tritrichomonas foetus TaxID=1144522 RepID=A0A1J4JMY4_9EUKA|nr:hypothetical protein TRFO_32791 [Tritrichomonas foetus]|eukprot:OHT00481.1 hypothetical protein TRFO_32791 [Tritrichomonas foetus]